ncbi:protein SGT1 homolog B-like [Malus domestica]|uniref:protein SGT1 homolog B-like n=1 Tax=Malus domestica TaxID=3750 RepID=UPI0004992112
MASDLKKRAKEAFIYGPFELAVASVNPKYRHEFYQKPEEVVVTIFAKGIPAKDVNVDFGEQILSVSIDVAGEDTYYFQPRLFGKIMPEKCRFDVLSTKVEIRLAKAEPLHWTSLEFSEDNSVPLRTKKGTEETGHAEGSQDSALDKLEGSGKQEVEGSALWRQDMLWGVEQDNDLDKL